MSRIIYYCFRVLRKIGIIRPDAPEYTDNFVEFKNQKANDYIANKIHNAKGGLMIAKWGTIELSVVCTLLYKKLHIKLKDFFSGNVRFDEKDGVRMLCKNAGFFPNDVSFAKEFACLALKDAREIDILGSYIYREKYIQEYIKKATKVNLDGYYAPFLWRNPWTKELKGKKVLVVHPFAETIQSQYQRREKLFENPDVLPEFAKLTVIKAVQSAAGNASETGFENWFQALKYMKDQMDQVDYEVAIIGCGAYGMSLAAHAKRRGKIAIHLAGWTQMLFGIYGKRWLEDQPEYSRFINEYWVRPQENERPKNAETVEGGCYW